MRDDDRSHQAYTARKASKLSRPKLDCGCPNDGPIYGHLWCDRLACSDHADDVHDCSAFGGAKSGTEKVSEPAGAAADLNAWTVAMQDWISPADIDRATARYRCRGCRLWIAQDVKLCGPCSALPPCPAERSAVEWGGAVVCFRPAGHDGQHESVQGRCWMDAPGLVEVEGHMEVRHEGPWTIIDETHIWRPAAADQRAEVTVATPEEAAEHTRTMETRSLECSRSQPMCSGCDGAAAWGSSPCLHDCHEADAPLVDAVPDPDPVTPRRRVAELYAALKARRTRRGGTDA